jgi:hypothetical protein
MKHLPRFPGMSRALPVVAALVLLLVSGLVHGLWTERWQRSPALAEAVARLGAVPLAVGDWQGKAVPVEEPEMFAAAGAAGYWARTYVHRGTGQAVLVVLMVGRFGPMSVHTPDVCCRAAGYDMLITPTRKGVATAAGPPAEVRYAVFRKVEAAVPRHLHIFWGWSCDGPLRAPDNPRRAFAGKPALYKLYVQREPTGPEDALDADPCLQLLGRLLPEMERALFPSQGPPTRTDN